MFTSFSAACKQLSSDYANNDRQWLEVEPEEYEERLNILDPIDMRGDCFLMGGCMTHNANDENLYVAFRRSGGKVEILLMTVKEWRQGSALSDTIPASAGFHDYMLALG